MNTSRQSRPMHHRYTSMLVAVACLLGAVLLTGCWDDRADDQARDSEALQRQQQVEASDKIRSGQTTPEGTVANGTVMQSVDRPDGEPVLMWKAGNDGAIEGGGGKPPKVTQDGTYFVTEVCTYHWNSGNGSPAGEITLNAADGTVYGPWKTTLRNKVYWIAQPNQDIPAGTYTLTDSDPSTWAQNSGSGGKGMGWAYGIPVK
jgi:hypothetical protein